jgi:hypothetical protein
MNCPSENVHDILGLTVRLVRYCNGNLRLLDSNILFSLIEIKILLLILEVQYLGIPE